jgi:hypothetical protein
MLITTIGNKIMDIHRRSYRIPIRKEGVNSSKDMLLGLKAIQVTSRNRVKISRNMSSRFTTQRIVFGILYLVSILARIRRTTKKDNLNRSSN